MFLFFSVVKVLFPLYFMKFCLGWKLWGNVLKDIVDRGYIFILFLF